MTRKLTPGRLLAWGVLAVALLITLFPFWWMLRTALTPAADLVTDHYGLWPLHPTLINFRRVLGMTSFAQAQQAGGSGASLDFPLYLRNSVIYSGVVATVQTLSCALAGYAFARMRFRGRDILFSMVLAALMIPPVFTLLPNFALMRQLGWLNSFAGLIAPSLLISPFAVFFLRQFFLNLPREVEEAAMIDGAGRWTQFWRVAVPMNRGPLLVIGLITAVFEWKDYFWPLVAAPDSNTRVLTAALGIFLEQSPNTMPDWTGLMAGSVLTVLPVLVLLVVFGRRLVESMNFTGIKLPTRRKGQYMKASRTAGAAAAAVAVAAALAGCGGNGGGGTSAGPVTLTYALWDNTQQPGYQQCADLFTRQHPDIKIKITQASWTNYWQNLTTQITAGNAPDVFTDHVAYFPQFVQDNQIVNIEPMVETAHINLNQYQAGLTNMWTKGGERFGLPKDWDTVAVVYNTKMLAAAGISPAQLRNWTWNPVDGGTFEQVIARLTLDKNGHNGLSPLFDKHAVKQYGIYLTYDDGGSGQNGWGDLAYENGFTFLDKNPFGTHYNYNSPALAQTISWLASLAQKGYAQPYSATSTLGPSAPLNAGQAAMTFVGDYNISLYSAPAAKLSFTYAPLPTGPNGRKTFINDLSDAIWSGTKHLQQAWQWVEFLASPACQNIVAQQGIIFPAIQGASANSVQVRTAKGQDVAPFVEEANTAAGTFFYPITYDGSQVQTVVQSGLDQVWTGKASASAALASIEQQVNTDMAQAGG